MINDVRFEDFIGIFDTNYNTQPLIDYWEYQHKCGATFNRKGIFNQERKPHQRKDQCLATEDFILDHNCGYEYMKQYNEITGECMELYVDEVLASDIINISQSYNVDAKIIGRVESCNVKKLTISSEFGEFIY